VKKLNFDSSDSFKTIVPKPVKSGGYGDRDNV
jgi:hypothetical protein